MNRDSQGRFSSFVSKVKHFVGKVVKYTIIGMFIVAVGFAFNAWLQFKGLEASGRLTPKVATSTQPTRLQQTEILINQLTEQRKKDASFIAETERKIKELKESREIDAKLDALFIVKTQLDMEISNLEAKTK